MNRIYTPGREVYSYEYEYEVWVGGKCLKVNFKSQKKKKLTKN